MNELFSLSIGIVVNTLTSVIMITCLSIFIHNIISIAAIILQYYYSFYQICLYFSVLPIFTFINSVILFFSLQCPLNPPRFPALYLSFLKADRSVIMNSPLSLYLHLSVYIGISMSVCRARMYVCHSNMYVYIHTHTQEIQTKRILMITTSLIKIKRVKN